MTVGSTDVFQVESLLRRVVADVAHRVHGGNWQGQLSNSIRNDIERCYKNARSAREGRVASNDPWSAAGLSQIKKVIRHFLENDEQSESFAQWLRPLDWDRVPRYRVDIDRLQMLRSESGHPDVSDPVASAVYEHQLALCRRVRLGCEQIERELMGDEDEQWFPYIERVVAPGIDEWHYERRALEGPSIATLNEGDAVEFVITAVNPVGPQEDLEYGLAIQPDGGSSSELELSDEPRLVTVAGPPGNRVRFEVIVRDRAGGHSALGRSDDEVNFSARIRPASLREEAQGRGFEFDRDSGNESP